MGRAAHRPGRGLSGIRQLGTLGKALATEPPSCPGQPAALTTAQLAIPLF